MDFYFDSNRSLNLLGMGLVYPPLILKLLFRNEASVQRLRAVQEGHVGWTPVLGLPRSVASIDGSAISDSNEMQGIVEIPKGCFMYKRNHSIEAALYLGMWLVLTGCANRPDANMQFIGVSGAPKAAGPYSQGVASDGLLFTAGFTPRDPVTNAPVVGDITVQTQRVFDNLEAVLKGAGCSWKDVLKVTVYMTNLGDFGKMNDVMAARMGDHKPARTTVGVSSLPSGVPLEIDVVARIPK